MDRIEEGKGMLKEVALRYAAQHGLHPGKVQWEERGGGEWLLRVETDTHSVKVFFSAEEIEDFPSAGPDTRSSKGKIRNAFAGLAM